MTLPSTGYEVPNYAEVFDALSTSIKTNLDPDLDITESTAIGQLVGSISGAITDVYEFAGAVNDSRKLQAAEGVNLDDIGALSNNQRNDGTPSTGVIDLRSTTSYSGLPITVAAATEFANTDTGATYTLDSEVEVSESACNYVKIKLNSLVQNELYSVDLGGTTGGPFTVDTSAVWPTTTKEVCHILAQKIILDPNQYATGFRDSDDTFTVTVNDPTSLTSVTLLPAALEVIEVGSVGNITGTVNSIDSDATGKITSIVTPVAGLDEVSNPLPLSAGSEPETDAEYRNSIVESTAIVGGGTYDAMQAKLENLVGVTSVNIEENVTESIVNSIPPHAFRVTVEGGTPQSIGELIWGTKPLGIKAEGNENVTVLDASGQQRTVRFSRPENWLIEVTINFQVDPDNGIAPDTTTERQVEIKNVVYEDGTTRYDIGKDVFASSFYQALYRDTSGYRFDSITLRYSDDAGDTWYTESSGELVTIVDNIKPIFAELNVIAVDSTPP